MLRRDRDDLRRRLEENADACGRSPSCFRRKKQALEDLRAVVRTSKTEETGGSNAFENGQKDVAAQKEAAAKAQALLGDVERDYRRLRSDVDGAQQRIGVLRSMEQEHEGLGPGRQGRPYGIAALAQRALRRRR